MKLPPLESVRYFETAARHLSFTLAAEELFVSQSAVSQKIIQLEERLGFKLFERRPRQLVLTEKGRQILPLVSLALEQIHDAFYPKKNESGARSLQLYCLPSFASLWLLPFLKSFYLQWPEIEVDLMAELTPPEVDSSKVRISITHGFGDEPQMLQKELFRDYIYPVAAPELVERFQLRNLENLHKVPLLHDSLPQAKLSTSWQRWLLDNDCHNVKANSGYRYNKADLVVNAALSGQGVALARHVLVAQEVAKGNLVPLTNRMTPDESVYIVCLKKHLEKQEVKKFFDWIEQVSHQFEHQFNINGLLSQKCTDKELLSNH